MNQRASLGLLGLSVVALAGCPPQVGPDYRGEALAVISGKVSVDEAGVDGLVPVLGWYNFGEPDEEREGDAAPGLLQEVEVDGAFPNQFTMRVYDLPPDGAMVPPGDGEPAIGLAMIFAANRDADWSEQFDGEEFPDWLAGSAENYMVLYLAGPSRDDGVIAGMFGGKVAKGYHLVEVREPTAEERDERRLCEEEGEGRAIARYNEEFGTDYESSFDLADDEYEDWSQIEKDESAECGGKIKMTIVPSGLDHPVQLHIGPDLQFLDWT